MSTELFRHIPKTYLPRRHLYWYARCKLASDPLYDGVGAALLGTQAPLLDLGCGIGLLAHTLAAQGFAGTYRGCDNDAQKIAAAIAAAAAAGMSRASFDYADLAEAKIPLHRGSVALLDVLQFLSPQAACALVENAAACIATDARLVIRTGLHEINLRTRFTHTIDALSRRVGWMNAAPKHYPRRHDLEALLVRCGLPRDIHTAARQASVQQLADRGRAHCLKDCGALSDRPVGGLGTGFQP